MKSSCPSHYIDTWSLQKKSDNVSSLFELVETEDAPHLLETVLEDDYLGEVVSGDGNLTLNIERHHRAAHNHSNIANGQQLK